MAYQCMFKVQVDPVRIEDVWNHIDEYALLFPCAKFKVVCPLFIGRQLCLLIYMTSVLYIQGGYLNLLGTIIHIVNYL